MARTGRNAAFFATSAHSGALGTGCARPGSSPVCAHCGSDAKADPPHTAEVPSRRPGAPTASKPLPVSGGSAVPTQTQQKYERFLRRAPAPTRLCTSRVAAAATVPAPAPARGLRSTPTRLPQLLGRGWPGRPRTSGPLRSAPLRSARTPPAAAAAATAVRSALGESQRAGRVGGGARRSRRPSRACRSHVSAGVTCSRRSQSRGTLSGSKEAVVRDRPRPEMFSSLAPAALGAGAAATETPAAAAPRRPSFRG